MSITLSEKLFPQWSAEPITSSTQKNWKINFRVGAPGHQIKVCELAFADIYGYKTRSIDGLISELKTGDTVEKIERAGTVSGISGST